MQKSAFTPTITPFRSDERNMITGSDTLLSHDAAFLPWAMGEEQLVTSIYYAMLDYMKIDKPGHEFHGKSLYDMYEEYQAEDPSTGQKYTDYRWRIDPKTGKPFIRATIIDSANNKVELTELNQKELSNMYTLYEKMQGGYHPMQRTILETNAFGQLFAQFHRYVFAILRNNFSGYGENYSEGKYLLKGRNEDGTPLVEWTPKITEGRYQTLAGVFLEYIRLSRLIKKDNKVTQIANSILPQNARSYKLTQLNDQQMENLVDASLTIIFSTILQYLHYLAFAGSDKDKLDK